MRKNISDELWMNAGRKGKENERPRARIFFQFIYDPFLYKHTYRQRHQYVVGDECETAQPASQQPNKKEEKKTQKRNGTKQKTRRIQKCRETHFFFTHRSTE